MALQTSGAISMSQIAAHFGGSGSHSLSEYHALAGKGVSGIPSSGSISFSHFHGKSNQVTTSVWVSSGYNQTSWVWQQRGNYGWMWKQNGDNMFNINVGGFYWNDNNERYPERWTTKTQGNLRADRGAFIISENNRNYYWAELYAYQTSWVDTSGYQNTTTTAQITT